jgi:CRISPR system Cascade subunit CasD
MTDYLVFQLYGSLASWGEPAVGEMRHTNSIPGRSSILGLLAAALGIKRADEELSMVTRLPYNAGTKRKSKIALCYAPR